ncbi:MAG: VOC family protein [Thermoanaerobaculia bacterium]
MKDRKQPETLRLKSVMPALTVNELSASLAWYRDVVGFFVADEMKDDAGNVTGAVLEAGDVRLLLSQDDFAKGRDRQKGVGLRLCCETRQDVDRLAAEIEARGGTLAHGPTDQPWGARDFAIIDPDGFAISISTGVAS